MKKKPTKETVSIVIESPSYADTANLLVSRRTKKELFEIAKSIGASCDALKWETAINIASILLRVCIRL